MQRIINIFSVPHEQLSIQIDPLEDDLAYKISSQAQTKILNFVTECRSELITAFESEDMDTVRTYLSSSFPADIKKFPDTPQSLRSRKWGIELDGSLNVADINEDHGKGHSLSRIRRKFFGSGEQLIFRANEYDKTQYGIRWQVLNSELVEAKHRRGSLFEARGANGVEGSSSNKFVNHETEQYDGEHWIKYYIYDKFSMRVVEIGRKFFVEVEK